MATKAGKLFIARGLDTIGYKLPHKVHNTIDGTRENLIVTPALEHYMLNNLEQPVSYPVSWKIGYLMSMRQRDRRFSWSASQAGLCLRRQELAFLGVKGYSNADARGLRIFANGTWVHLRWQAYALTADIIQDAEVTYKSVKKNARATLDGEGIAKTGDYKGEKFGLELKGRNDNSYFQQLKRGGPDDKTLKQVNMQMWLSGFEVFSVVNENKNDQRVVEWIVHRDRAEIRKVIKDIDRMNDDTDRMKLHPMLPECVKQNKSGEFYKCPFGTPNGPCANIGDWPKGI